MTVADFRLELCIGTNLDYSNLEHLPRELLKYTLWVTLISLISIVLSLIFLNLIQHYTN